MLRSLPLLDRKKKANLDFVGLLASYGRPDALLQKYSWSYGGNRIINGQPSKCDFTSVAGSSTQDGSYLRKRRSLVGSGTIVSCGSL